VNWFTGIMVYVILWWLALFAVLPIGHRDQIDPEPGTPESAPEKPRIWLKFSAATLIAAVLWGVFFLVVEYDPFDFRTFMNTR
jgi:predicted secreted protein